LGRKPPACEERFDLEKLAQLGGGAGRGLFGGHHWSPSILVFCSHHAILNMRQETKFVGIKIKVLYSEDNRHEAFVPNGA
jgi:hypothetical protein